MANGEQQWSIHATPRVVKRGDGPKVRRGEVVGLLYKVARTEAELADNKILESNYDSGCELIVPTGRNVLNEYAETHILHLEIGSVILFNVSIDVGGHPNSFVLELYLSSIRADENHKAELVIFDALQYESAARKRPSILLNAIENPKRTDPNGHLILEIRAADYPAAIRELTDIGFEEVALKPLGGANNASPVREFLMVKNVAEEIQSKLTRKRVGA